MSHEIAVHLFFKGTAPFLHSYAIGQLEIEKRISIDLKAIDFGAVTEAQIIFFPNQGRRTARCDARTWFKRGTHIPAIDNTTQINLATLQEVHGLHEKFEESRRCLERICQYLGARLHCGTSLTFDFIEFAPADAAALLACFHHIGKVKQMQVGFDGRHLPAGGLAVVKQLIKQAINQQLRPTHAITKDCPPYSSAPTFQFVACRRSCNQ